MIDQERCDNKNENNPCVESSFSIFVYPVFFFQAGYENILNALLDSPEWKIELPDLNDEADIRHLRYFIPYVKQFLFPEAFQIEKLKEVLGPKNIFMEEEEAFDYYKKPYAYKKHKRLRRAQLNTLKDFQVVRWRWDFNESSEVQDKFNLTNTKGNKHIKAHFYKVSLLVFPTGLGLLLLEVYPENEDITLTGLAEFNKIFNCLEDLPFGGRYAAQVEGKPLYDVINDVFLARLSDNFYLREGIYSLGQSFLNYYCFACIENTGESIQDSPVFNSFIMENKELSRTFNIQNNCCTFSKNGAVILSVHNTPGPAPEDLKRHWRTFYLDIYLHALYHRLSLLKFSWELSEIKKLLKDNKKVQWLHRMFLEFSNKAWFSQLTNTEFGQILWREWKEVMETEELYEEVKLQIRELDEFLDRKQQGHVKRLINGITIVLAPLTVLTALFSTRFFEVKNSWQISLMNAFILSGVLLFLVLVIVYFFIRWSLKKFN